MQDILHFIFFNKAINGKYIELFEKKIAEYVGVNFAVATGSGRQGLELLFEAYNLEKGDEIMAMAMNQDGTGYLDMVRTGQIALSQDEGLAKHSGIIREISINSNTTGSIIDVRGRPTVDWDVIKIVITTAGTFASSSASSVKYATYVGDDTGLKIDESTDPEIIDGGFQDVGHGMQVRFSPGVYTINDEWELEVSGEVSARTMAVKYAEAERI